MTQARNVAVCHRYRKDQCEALLRKDHDIPVPSVPSLVCMHRSGDWPTMSTTSASSCKTYDEVAGLRTLVVNVRPATEHIIASVRSR